MTKLNREEVEKHWAEEAEQRIDAYDRGELKALSVSEVFAELKKRSSPSLTPPPSRCKFKLTAK